jgi:hypothetical protein
MICLGVEMFKHKMSAAAIVLTLATMPALAQTRGGPLVPAELPPASFTGAQYVDSQGCVFMRAGFNGRVNWVPRYGDDRRPMCGMQPTMAGGTAPAIQPRASAPVAVAAATAPARPRAPAPQYIAPPPQIIQAQALDRRWSFADRVGPSPCTHMTPHSQMYMVPSPARPDLPIRCGPQSEHPADALRSMSPNNGQWVPWNGTPGVMEPNVYQLPPAYAPSWPDAHLAPRHAPQGHAATMHHASSAVAPRAHVSTQGAVAPRPVAAGHRYVQVGSFGVPQNAQATAARLQAQGMPVAMSQQRLRGQLVQVVMAGPFGSAGEVSAALGTARAMGFRDAFTRN